MFDESLDQIKQINDEEYENIEAYSLKNELLEVISARQTTKF